VERRQRVPWGMESIVFRSAPQVHTVHSCIATTPVYRANCCLPTVSVANIPSSAARSAGISCSSASRPASSPPVRLGGGAAHQSPSGGCRAQSRRPALEQLRSDSSPPAAAGGALIEGDFPRPRHFSRRIAAGPERSYSRRVGAVVTAADARDHETTGTRSASSLTPSLLARRLGIRGEELKPSSGAAPARRGQDVGPGRDPAQNGPPHDRGVGHHEATPNLGFDMLPRSASSSPRALGHHLQPSRARDAKATHAPRGKGDPPRRRHLRRRRIL